jgi:hypothetical protein
MNFISPSRVLVGALLLAGTVTLSACASTTPVPAPTASSATGADAGATAECAGVTVIVDFGQLDSPAVSECVDTDASGAAAGDILASAGIETVGTTEWGDQVVCRVNDRPAANEAITVDGEAPFTEACETMPAANAYWALWLKPSAEAEWDYALEGVGTLSLKPGESVGLVFTTGTDVTTPGN